MDATAPDALLYSGPFGNLIPRLNPNRADLREDRGERNFVYALIDPRDDRVRYIGLSRNLHSRLHHHIYSSHTKDIAAWIAEMRNAGCSPRIAVLDECRNLNVARFVEQRAIAEYEGFHGGLLNDRQSYTGKTKDSVRRLKLITDDRARSFNVQFAMCLYPAEIPAHTIKDDEECYRLMEIGA